MGTVTTLAGLGLPDVLLNFSNGGGTVMTYTSGYYALQVPAGWSGTVTPFKAGCIFTPADRSYSNVTANIGGEDYGEYLHAVSVPVSPNGLSRGEKERFLRLRERRVSLLPGSRCRVPVRLGGRQRFRLVDSRERLALMVDSGRMYGYGAGEVLG